jgi:uncharacterized protein
MSGTAQARTPDAPASLAARIAARDWDAMSASLDAQGYALLPKLLSDDDGASLAALYGDAARFRSRVIMARHGFGQGEYQYFAYPLPEPVATLRAALYPHLAPIANRWAALLGIAQRYPARHADYLKRCHDAGQTRPTPLLLKYEEGDYNRLHQDLYGAEIFPLQATFLLSAPGEDFTGGEFMLTEQRPRRQSRAEVVPLEKGDGVIFAVRERPQQGARGSYRVALRHGVSRLRSGNRLTLGVIFHDAR